MAKWADYVITGVRYDKDGERITAVEVRRHTGTHLVEPSIWSRVQVIQIIDKGYTFVTSYLHDGSWRKGADVHVVTIGRERFLRTDKNKTKKDNLGELPEV